MSDWLPGIDYPEDVCDEWRFQLERAEQQLEKLREFVQAFKHWVDHDAPTEEWDGGSLGYEVGGLYSMADAALTKPGGKEE